MGFLFSLINLYSFRMFDDMSKKKLNVVEHGKEQQQKHRHTKHHIILWIIAQPCNNAAGELICALPTPCTSFAFDSASSSWLYPPRKHFTFFLHIFTPSSGRFHLFSFSSVAISHSSLFLGNICYSNQVD